MAAKFWANWSLTDSSIYLGFFIYALFAFSTFSIAGSEASIFPFPPIEVGDGYSALRLADVEGKHEWVAGYERDGFNYAKRSLRQIAAFHRCGGRLVLDEDPECMQSEDCTLFNTLYLRQECLLEPSSTTGD